MEQKTQTKQVGDPKVLKALTGNTQAELARKTGLTESYLSMVLAGKRMPRMESMIKLARALGVTVELFYRHLTLRRAPAGTDIASEIRLTRV